MTAVPGLALADSRRIILNARLCFMFGKHGRYAVKILKILLFDFFNVDTISSAKELLVSIIVDLKLTGV